LRGDFWYKVEDVSTPTPKTEGTTPAKVSTPTAGTSTPAPDPCKPNPCQHKGTCTVVNGTFVCNCNNTGYTGQKCDKDVDECKEDNGLCNHGECKNLPGAYECKCKKGYTGDHCKQAKWEFISRTEPTCKGKPLSTREDITEEECIKYAKETEKANFAFYAFKTAEWDNSDSCALFKSCDPKNEGKIPTRPGKTFEKKSDGEWDVIAESEPTCFGKPVFRKEGKNLVTFDKCIELLYTIPKTNFVWFNDITMKSKAYCAGYEKCDLKKKAVMPGKSGVTIQEKATE